MKTRSSTTGQLFLTFGVAISWKSKLQPIVATSSTEAEYMEYASATKKALWLRELLGELEVHLGTVDIKGDNQGSLKLLKHSMASERSKHIDIMHHFERERVMRGEVKFEYCPTNKMLANFQTKVLPA